MIRIVLLCAGALAMTGCATMSEEEDMPPPPVEQPEIIDRTGEEAGLCAAEDFQHLIGQRASEIHTGSLPHPYRIYGPNDAVTMDYRLDRMNIVTDADGLVIRVRCG